MRTQYKVEGFIKETAGSFLTTAEVQGVWLRGNEQRRLSALLCYKSRPCSVVLLREVFCYG